MATFAVYRSPRELADRWNRPRPTRVKTIQADTATEAASTFLASLPAGGGWDVDSHILEARGRGRTVDLWLRRFTPTGIYKGETHFMVWPGSE